VPASPSHKPTARIEAPSRGFAYRRADLVPGRYARLFAAKSAPIAIRDLPMARLYRTTGRCSGDETGGPPASRVAGSVAAGSCWTNARKAGRNRPSSRRTRRAIAFSAIRTFRVNDIAISVAR